MQTRKLTVALVAGIVVTTMLACNLSILPTENPTEGGAPGVITDTPPAAPPITGVPTTATDTPELYLPPPVSAFLQVVYVKSGNVWVWTEGGIPQQLTSAGNDSNPKLSSDGQIVAFNRGGELWAANIDGSNERLLVDLAFIGAYAHNPGDKVVVDDILWLPQTHSVVFNTLEIAEGSGYQEQLFDYKAANAESGISATASPGEGGVPYISPDNAVLALAQFEKVIIRFTTINAPYEEVFTFPVVLTYSEWLYVPELVWLPDSSAFRLVVPAHDPLSEPDQVSTFWNVPVSGTPTRLANFHAAPAFLSTPFVSPDGQKVVYQVDSGANTEIHSITADGVDTLLLSFPLNTVELLGWHPDSVRFMFSQPDPIHANLGSASGFQPLGDTPKVQKIHWVDDNRYLFMNGNELRISVLGGSSTLVDAGVQEYDMLWVVH